MTLPESMKDVIKPHAMKRRRVLLIGTFYPTHQFAGNSTTGIAGLLAILPSMEMVTVIAQRGASTPVGRLWASVRVIPCWQHNSLLSLLRLLRTVAHQVGDSDSVVFNTYLTAFGKSKFTNAMGLMLPTLVARLHRVPVTTYMHNMFETQDVRSLGYSPSQVDYKVVRFIEKMLLQHTRVALPLRSQVEVVSREFGLRAVEAPLPFVETFVAMGASWTTLKKAALRQRDGTLRVLLFGNWGPQKDLTGALEALATAIQVGAKVEVVIGGCPSPMFPDYLKTFNELRKKYSSKTMRFIGQVKEEEVLVLIANSDAVLLPYRATGGYSGALNCAALLGRLIIAYDQPQLREHAAELGVAPVWVGAGDVTQLASTILHLSLQSQEFPFTTWEAINAKIAESCWAVAHAIGIEWPGIEAVRARMLELFKSTNAE